MQAQLGTYQYSGGYNTPRISLSPVEKHPPSKSAWLPAIGRDAEVSKYGGGEKPFAQFRLLFSISPLPNIKAITTTTEWVTKLSRAGSYSLLQEPQPVSSSLASPSPALPRRAPRKETFTFSAPCGRKPQHHPRGAPPTSAASRSPRPLPLRAASALSLPPPPHCRGAEPPAAPNGAFTALHSFCPSPRGLTPQEERLVPAAGGPDTTARHSAAAASASGTPPLAVPRSPSQTLRRGS